MVDSNVVYVPIVERCPSFKKPVVRSTRCTPKKFICVVTISTILLVVVLQCLLTLRHMLRDLHLRTDIDGELVKVSSEVSRKHGAVCLDGSSTPGYYIKRGVDNGESRWLISVIHSPWCKSFADCHSRSKVPLEGTMKNAPLTYQFTGIFSSNPMYNTYFADWNMVQFVPCDGAMLLGNQTIQDNKSGVLLQSKGAAVISAIMDHLKQVTDIENSEEIVLYGKESGAVSIMLYSNYIKQQLPKVRKLTLISHSGLLVNTNMTEYNTRLLVELHRVNDNKLISGCSSLRCLNMDELIKKQTTPVIIYGYLEALWPMYIMFGCSNQEVCTANHYNEKYKLQLQNYTSNSTVSPSVSIILFSCDWPIQTTLMSYISIGRKTPNSVLVESLRDTSSKFTYLDLKNDCLTL